VTVTQKGGRMPRRLLLVGDWPWTDSRPDQHRLGLFLASGEALTTIFLAAYAVIVIWPGSTFATSPAFALLRDLADHRAGFWGVIAVALAITGPVALAMDSGSLRILSLVSQGLFFLFLANSVRLGTPASFLLGMVLASGCWLILRATALVRHHWQGGRRDGRRGG
jgi:hypothetical protein